MSLLINESPLIVLPSLANKIGVDKAIALQQLHFFLQNPKLGFIDENGIKWFRNSLADWQEHNFHFWSESKISRLYNDLEKQGYVTSRSDLNNHGYDRTKWYTLNYDYVNTILQNCELHFSKLQDASSSSARTIPKNTSKNTSNTLAVDSFQESTDNGFKQSEILPLEDENEQMAYEEIQSKEAVDLFDLLNPNQPEEKSNENQIPDSKHPTIIMWKRVNRRYPSKRLYGFVINQLGNNPDENTLKHVCQKWAAKGFNPTNIDGQLQWYKKAVEWQRQNRRLEDFDPTYYQNKKEDDNDFHGTLRGLTIE